CLGLGHVAVLFDDDPSLRRAVLDGQDAPRSAPALHHAPPAPPLGAGPAPLRRPVPLRGARLAPLRGARRSSAGSSPQRTRQSLFRTLCPPQQSLRAPSHLFFTF